LHLDSSLSPEAVTFQTTKGSAGYDLHLKGVTQQSDKDLIEQIAKKHSLEVKQERDGLTIFKPFPPPSSH
jgi:hypothetical protein